MEAKTVKEVLIAARWIIANKGWCQGSYAQAEDGTEIWSFNNKTLGQAACFCLAGAIQAVDSNNVLEEAALDFLGTLPEVGLSAIKWNDGKNRTKKQVLALFDKAIKRLEDK